MYPASEARLDQALGEADFGRHTEPLEDRAPLGEESAVSLGAPLDERAARLVVNHWTCRPLEQALRTLALLCGLAAERPTGE